MKAAINIGNELSEQKETLMQAAAAIATVLQVGHDTHADQDTISDALEALSKIASINNVTITNSTFTGDRVVNMDEV